MSESVKTHIFKDEDMTEKFHSLTDPFPPSLARFFKQVTLTNPIQSRLLRQYIDYPSLRETVIKMDRDPSNGELLGFKIRPKAYQEAKKKLKL